MKRNWRVYLLSIGILILIIGSWEFYIIKYDISDYMLPSPEKVLFKFIEILLDGTLLRHSFATSMAIILGFGIGSGLGFLGGNLLTKSRSVEKTIMPYVFILQSTPKVAFIPLLVIWFGLGFASKLILVVLSAFFPVMLNTLMSFKSIDPSYFELMNILKATKRQIVFKVKVPLSMPMIFAGLKVGMVQSVIGAIVSEWVSGQSGLGYLLVFGSTQFSSDLLMAGIFATTFLGLFFYGIIAVVENKVLFWHRTKQIVLEA